MEVSFQPFLLQRKLRFVWKLELGSYLLTVTETESYGPKVFNVMMEPPKLSF